MIHNRNQRLIFLLSGMASLLLLAPLGAQMADRTPDELEGVEITEHLGEKIPLDPTFTDENGDQVCLRDFFPGDRPVLLTLNYYSCTMLCGLQLNGLARGLKELDWTPGQEFEIVTVSINPKETPQLAKLRKQEFMKEYERPSAAAGWHFLTGKKENIDKLAEAVGFGYRYDEPTNQYIHSAVVHVLTPDGEIARYLYGVMYEPKTLRLSLIEAAEGKIGSTLDQVLLFCFHYDAKEGKYAPAALNIMRAGGLFTALIIGAVLLTFWLRDASRKKTAPKEQDP